MASNGVGQACPPRGKRVKKGVGIDRLYFTSWNVGTLTSKSIELVQALHRDKVNIAYIQETKWVRAKAHESTPINCRIWVVQELEMELVF